MHRLPRSDGLRSTDPRPDGRSDGRSDGLLVDTANPSAFSPAFDRASMSPSFSLVSAPAGVNPEPAYIAAAAAANVATSEIVSEFELEDRDFEGASVTAGSLALINAFLDRLLFNFLTSARSTTLAALRPAVVEVLKPRLAKEAIDGADEELHEYLGTDDEELAADDRSQTAGEWDMDVVWKRTRLRCMVYTRLGDMEEEDEDMLLDDGASDLPARTAVSPAVAIFLTAILEHVAEHALAVAAQAAFIRVETRARIENHQTLRRIVVEEGDMEKVALNSTLGRLWRAWRKLVRSPHSPRSSISRLSRDGGAASRLRGFRTASTSRKTSSASLDSRPIDTVSTTQPPSVAEVPDEPQPEPEPEPDPCAVPLPLTEHDVAEIEVPNYSPALTQKNRTLAGRARFRPHSLYYPEAIIAQESSAIDEDDSQTSTPRAAMLAFPGRRGRSSSLPTPQTPFFALPEQSETDSVFETPAEEAPPQDWGAESEPELSALPRESASSARKQSAAKGQQQASASKGQPEQILSKPNSAPSSPSQPFQGSVLNTLSRQVRDLPVPITKPPQSRHPSGTSERDIHSEGESTDAPLQFGRDDYKIDENERATSEAAAAAAREQVLPISPPKTRHRPPRLPLQKSSRDRVLEAKPVAAADPPAVTPRNFSKPTHGGSAAVGGGDVSPVGHVSIPSGEVSPIESGDELEVGDAKSVVVSPLVQRSFQTSPPRAAAAPPPVTDVPPRAPVGPERPRRRGGPTEDDYVKEEKREAYVLPEEYSAPQSTKPSGAVAPTKRAVEPVKAVMTNKELPPIDPAAGSKKRFKTPGESGGPANLSPLHEFRESAPASSQPTAAPLERSARPTVSSPPNMVNSLGPAAVIGDAPRSVPQPAPVTGADRTGPTSEPARSKRSIDSTRRKLSGAHHESTLSRASTDSRSDSKPGSSPRAPQKSFEQLINSGETLSYTLTPQTMQEIEGRDSPTGSFIVAKRQPGSPVSPRVPPPERSSPKSSRLGHSASYSSPKPESPVIGSTPQQPQHVAAASGSSFVIQPGPAVKRGPQPVPREARTDRVDTSTRDFADFIRSTGPDAPAPAPATVLSGTSASAVRPGRVPRAPRKDGLSAMPASAADRVRPPGAKPRLQAREPVIPSNGTADLVQFLNSGPPGASAARNPLKADPHGQAGLALDPKTGGGAGAGGERRTTKDSISVSSAHDSFAAHSFVSSNSRTGLLDANKTVPAKRSPQANGKRPIAGPSPTSFASEAPGMPARKQRRVRDPYALDSDSEGNENGDAIVGPGRKGGSGRQEESLIDFLNSVPPPETNNTPPRLDVGKSPLKGLGRKSSAPAAVRANSGRSGPLPRSKPVIPPGAAGSLDDSAPTGGASLVRGNTVAAAGNGYSGTNPGLRYQPSSSQSPATAGSSGTTPVRNGAGGGSMQNKARMRPRTAREDESGLRELASFLKNSGPPEVPDIPPTLASRPNGKEREDSGGFSRMFSRRKKAAATA